MAALAPSIGVPGSMKIAREIMEMRDMVAELCAIVKNYLSMERSEMLVNYEVQ
jgi:hypothetical protein